MGEAPPSDEGVHEGGVGLEKDLIDRDLVFVEKAAHAIVRRVLPQVTCNQGSYKKWNSRTIKNVFRGGKRIYFLRTFLLVLCHHDIHSSRGGGAGRETVLLIFQPSFHLVIMTKPFLLD